VGEGGEGRWRGGGERRGEDRGAKLKRSEGETKGDMWEEGKERGRRGEGEACMWEAEGGESKKRQPVQLHA